MWSSSTDGEAGRRAPTRPSRPFGCWVKTPGQCVQDDPAREVARACARADLVVLFTPVTFGGYSSELKKAIDRSIPNLSPIFIRIRGETHHPCRYASRASLAA